MILGRRLEQQQSSLGASLRNTFKALSDWGDDFERKHFDGDFLGKMSNAPCKVGESASFISEELGVAAAKLLEEAVGQAGKGPDGDAVTSSSVPTTVPAQTPASSSTTPPESLLEQFQELQAESAKEREQHRGRASALASLDEAIRHLRAEVVEEARLLELDEAERDLADTKETQTESVLEALQKEHYAARSRKAAQEADLRRFEVAAAAEQHAAREASRAGAWARDGPETEALKDAKIALAEALGQLDEVRLRGRREIAELQQVIEVAQAENARLIQQVSDRKLEEHKSITKSMWKMLSGSRARSDAR